MLIPKILISIENSYTNFIIMLSGSLFFTQLSLALDPIVTNNVI